MEYIVGTTLALFFCAAAAGLGMDRERVFYPAATIATVFIVGAVLGFKRNPWITVVALGGHGVMDSFHGHLAHNNGVPASWPGFCMTFDVTAAVIVALVMLARARSARHHQNLELH